MQINKILVIRLSSIGDIVLSTPLIRSLRKKFPGAIIDFAIKKEFAVLMEHNPYVNNLIIVDSKQMGAAKKRVRENQYDWIIDIQKSSRATQLITGSGATTITSYSKEKFSRFFLINFKMNMYANAKPVFLRYFEAVEKMGVAYDGLGTEVFITETEGQKAKTIIGSFRHKGPLVTICPGAKYTNKQWTTEGFVSVARQLQEQQQANILILGGPGEETLGVAMAASIGGNVLNVAGQLNLLESAALLQHSDLVIANDSGLMHLAQSQKTPVVAIYGPTVKEFGFFPLQEKSKVIETHLSLSCRPCTKMGKDHCPNTKHDHACMVSISPERVYEACVSLLLPG